MTDDQVTSAVRDAGFVGWKGVLRRHPEAAGFVAILTSPDYDPVRRRGLIHVARGRDEADAFALALERAQGGAVQ
ncbi:hypothetical protein BBAL3_2424 [Brevundimonas sp. BAL3]|uniref:hypothetical protein n=1 Tax=Brevundimonas sp. BAL3 TaxID=391600 RepID=UPI00017EBEAF|nr:hypothetical protein [Brevundimonas sp. BAL3]EDX81267.1 hypothetical protein BBAL3_2424 [Brevundimonas sp. BAL3]